MSPVHSPDAPTSDNEPVTVTLDLTACDREPIHIPGAVQPHGLLLVADGRTGTVVQAGGDAAGLLGCSLEDTIGKTIPALVGELTLDGLDAEPTHVGRLVTSAGVEVDVLAHRTPDLLIAELEPAPAKAPTAAAITRTVETVTRGFSARRTIDDLADLAAEAFRDATGFDRVMVYRFLPDDSGSVIAERTANGLNPFLNHRFPATDIPKQARELYVRNIIRVIPDVGYTPAPMLSAIEGPPLDMSRCDLRAISPIHIQYLKNMGVGASASMSIVVDGHLWGLVACHHNGPRRLNFDDRMVCRLLASALSQQVSRVEEAELYRMRIAARAAEDEFLGLLARGESVLDQIEAHLAEMLKLLPATGAALRIGTSVQTVGAAPTAAQIADLGDWLAERSPHEVFSTDQLGAEYPKAEAYADVASGVLATPLAGGQAAQLLWFRAEQVQLVEWAGNPHKAVDAPGGELQPRTSFDIWREEVRGRSERWSLIDRESAGRLGREIVDIQHRQSLVALNDSLLRAIGQRDAQLSQQSQMLRESDHRIKNSLQIVSGMLSMQLRQTTDPEVRLQLEEALGRINAVTLVHNRLYRAKDTQSVELDVYLNELLADVGASLGDAWKAALRIRVSPVIVPAALVLPAGLIVTELVLNAVKYAYGGDTGPIEVSGEERHGRLVLRVADRGQGSDEAAPTGFGSRLIGGLIQAAGGTLERQSTATGLTVTAVFPLSAGAAAT